MALALVGQAGFEPTPFLLPFELLSHITAGHGSTPAGGLCLLSALDRLGDSHFWHRTRMRPGGRGRIRTGDARFCRPPLCQLSYADHYAVFPAVIVYRYATSGLHGWDIAQHSAQVAAFWYAARIRHPLEAGFRPPRPRLSGVPFRLFRNANKKEILEG